MNKEKKIGVSKVVIQMGNKEATLTVEQARELREALNALLGEKVVERVVERDRWYPYTPYVYPQKIYCGDVVFGTVSGTTANDTYGNVTGTYTINVGGGDPLLLR